MPTQTATDTEKIECKHPISGCRWLVFDAVGTLIEPAPPVSVAYHAVGTRYGSRLSIDEVGRRFRQAFHASETDGFPDGPPRGAMLSNDAIEEARWRWIVGEVFADIGDRERCFRELWDHFATPASWRCFEDVSNSLRRLSREGYRLAIASNFDRRLHRVCDALQELKVIEKRVVSAEVGYRKPAPEFYVSLIAACACEPHEILMIGDNHEHDVHGPESAGMRAIHLERRQHPAYQAQLNSLSELVERLVDHGHA